MKRSLIVSVVVALLIGSFAAFVAFHSSSIALLNPQGPIGVQERNVMLITVAFSSIVVIPLFAMLFVFAWKYREDNPASHVEHEPNWDHDSYVAEFVWWLVPTAIVAFLAVVMWQSTHALDPYKPLHGSNPPIIVQVVALDWKWLFIYPQQGIATVNMLEIPENAPVTFQITSDAPMNSFWIPKLGGQIMAMPGMTNQLNLLASTVGTYTGSSANISGAGFAGMNFPVKSVSESDFSAWVQSVKNMQHPLTQTGYTALLVPSQYVPPLFYSSVDANLYTSVIMKYMMPAMKGNSMASNTANNAGTMPADMAPMASSSQQ
jgi:cytochrome o ubiquinol oxidase subunit 2